MPDQRASYALGHAACPGIRCVGTHGEMTAYCERHDQDEAYCQRGMFQWPVCPSDGGFCPMCMPGGCANWEPAGIALGLFGPVTSEELPSVG